MAEVEKRPNPACRNSRRDRAINSGECARSAMLDSIAQRRVSWEKTLHREQELLTLHRKEKVFPILQINPLASNLPIIA